MARHKGAHAGEVGAQYKYSGEKQMPNLTNG